MKRLNLLFAFILAMVLVGCSNEEIVPKQDIQYVSELTLNFGSGNTRVAYEHNATTGLKFSWEDQEEIVVYENANAEATALYYVYDAASSTFKPKDEASKMVSGTQYFAVKGRRNVSPLSVEDGKTVVQMVTEETGNGLPHIPMITDVFTASATGTVATMHHLVGVIEVPVKLAEGSAGTSVDMFSYRVSGGKVSWNFTATPEAPYVKDVSEASETSNSEEKTYALSTETATPVFIPVLPGTFGEGRLNYFYGNSSAQIITEAVTVERGKITKLTEKTIEIWE